MKTVFSIFGYAVLGVSIVILYLVSPRLYMMFAFGLCMFVIYKFMAIFYGDILHRMGVLLQKKVRKFKFLITPEEKKPLVSLKN